MTLQREVCVSRGGVLARLLDSAVQLLRGRRLQECGRCFGCGVQKVTRLEWRPDVPSAEATCMLTTCVRCSGVGQVWR